MTVIAGYSIIQKIRVWSLSKTNNIAAKSFPVDTTEDLEDFNRPILRKKPDRIIINAEKNDQKVLILT